jgi:hypothetical protein
MNFLGDMLFQGEIREINLYKPTIPYSYQREPERWFRRRGLGAISGLPVRKFHSPIQRAA